MSRRKKQIALVTVSVLGVLVMLSSGCVMWAPLPRPANPPEEFREENLVGVWKADYERYDWRLCYSSSGEEVVKGARSLEEWLVLREDRSFYQVLHDRQGLIPDQQVQGSWWVERFPDGVTRLHLVGGKFFAGAVCYSFPELDIGGGYYSSDQTGHKLVFEPNKAVIIVGWDEFTNTVYLEYPLVGGDPDAPIIVKFARVSESEIDSVPTPVP